MQPINVENGVFVFDLDDTLYAEADYRFSGVRAICAHILTLYGRDIADTLMTPEAQRGDFLSLACELADLPLSAKEALLWVYRLHEPVITLSPGGMDLVTRLLKDAAGVAILTDGRSASQRLKMQALGLSTVPAYISEDFQSVKPEEKRFRQIMLDFPSKHYVYVGDNPAKDFIAPNTLGWTTVGVKGCGRNIHSQDCSNLKEDLLPAWWIDDLYGLTEFLC